MQLSLLYYNSIATGSKGRQPNCNNCISPISTVISLWYQSDITFNFVEFNQIKLNWVKLNWVQLNWVKLIFLYRYSDKVILNHYLSGHCEGTGRGFRDLCFVRQPTQAGQKPSWAGGFPSNQIKLSSIEYFFIDIQISILQSVQILWNYTPSIIYAMCTT